MDAAYAIGRPREEEANADEGPARAPEPRTGSYESLMQMFRPR